MTYIIDLHQLWEESASLGAASQEEPQYRKNVVSVVVVATGSGALLLQTLNSVISQPFVREVIIVHCEENPAFDKALATFVRKHPKCYIVRGDKNKGLAALYNLGAQHACGQFLLLMKGNCLLAKNAMAKLLATGILKPSPWVVGVANKPTWHHLNPMGRLGALFSDPFDTLNVHGYQQEALPEVSLPGGGFHTYSIGPECLFLPTQSFLELKGLDKKCFHSTFHVDLCLRVHFAGGGVYRAREFDVHAFAPVKQSIMEALRNEWQGFCGRYHFYGKHIGKKNNKLLMLFVNGLLVIGFVFRSCLGLVPKRLSKKSKVKYDKLVN